MQDLEFEIATREDDISIQRKPVLFISSALSPDNHPDKSKVFDYFVVIAAKLSIELRHLDYEVILRVPYRQKTAARDQKLFLEELRNIKLCENYSGVIIAPFDTEAINESLALLMSKNKCDSPVPILTIDKYIKKFTVKSTNEKPPHYVVGDWVMGGKLAAQSIMNYFEHNKTSFPRGATINIAVMKGLEGSDERIEGFQRALKEGGQSGFTFDIVTTLNGGFNRSVAKQVVNDCYDSLLEKKVKAFFCCNDEMALGVRDFLFEKNEWFTGEIYSIKGKKNPKINAYKKRQRALHNIKIVGFDGVSEVRVLTDNRDKWLLNSVDVQIFEQVRKLAILFKKCIEGEEVGPDVVEVALVKKFHQQNNTYY